jgi:hypothetical protein
MPFGVPGWYARRNAGYARWYARASQDRREPAGRGRPPWVVKVTLRGKLEKA